MQTTVSRSGLARWIVLTEGPRDSVGLHTTNESKAAMCKATQEVLSFDALFGFAWALCGAFASPALIWTRSPSGTRCTSTIPRSGAVARAFVFRFAVVRVAICAFACWRVWASCYG